MSKLFKTESIWIASCIVYLYGEDALAQIDDVDGRKSVYGLAAPAEDIKIVLDEYTMDRLALSSAKSFVDAFNFVSQKQKEMRRSGEGFFSSSGWITGRVG